MFWVCINKLENKSNPEVKWKSLSRVWLFVTPWSAAHQAPLSTGFCRQEEWSGSPFSSPGALPHPKIERRCPALQADSLPSETPEKPQSDSKNQCKNLSLSNSLFDFRRWEELPIIYTSLLSLKKEGLILPRMYYVCMILKN